MTAKGPLPQARLQQAIARAKELGSANKAAKEFGIATSTITRAMKRLKPEPPATEPAQTKIDGNGSLKPVDPGITIGFKPVAEKDMPHFTAPTPTPTATPEAKPQTATMPPPGSPSTPVVDPMLAALGVVETISLVVNKYWVDEALQEGKPPGPLTDEEKRTLASAWAPAISKYAPLWAKYAIEINVLSATLLILGPRWQYAKRQHEDRVKAKKREIEAKRAAKPAEAPPPAEKSKEATDLELGKRIEKRLKNLR